MKFHKLFFLFVLLINASCTPWIDMSDIDSGQVEKYSLLKKMTARNGEAYDCFGADVSISGDGKTLLIGAIGDNELGVGAGAAYIYRWENDDWVETKLLATGGKPEDYFGQDVALSADGNTALIGVNEYDELGTYAGAAYVYKWENKHWVETKLTAKNGKRGDLFGSSVSLTADGNMLLIGAQGPPDRKGSAYIFKLSNNAWEETSLAASDGLAGNCFGASGCLSADGQTALVGAHLDDDYTGCAYIYRWNNGLWEETRLAASDGDPWELFGFDVSLSADGKTALIGATYWNTQGPYSGSGAAYIYRWQNNVWVEKKLVAGNEAENMRFGISTALSADGNIALVGAGNEAGEGAAYVYQWLYSRWIEQRLPAQDETGKNDFGNSVAVTADGRTVLIGAYTAESIGAAYLFNRK